MGREELGGGANWKRILSTRIRGNKAQMQETLGTEQYAQKRQSEALRIPNIRGTRNRGIEH